MLQPMDTLMAKPPAEPVRFDDGRHRRAKIGYLLLATEQTITDDVYTLAPSGVGLHFTRVAIPDSITVESLEAQADLLAEAAALLLPDGSLDVVCYACTSGSLVIGEDRVLRELTKGAPAAKATSLITGVIRALRQVGARRLVVGTPYLEAINERERSYLEKAGFEVLTIEGLDIEHDSDMVRVTPEYLEAFALSLDRPDADALFLSCGALRTLEIVERLENRIGKPVIVSNQAMIWDTLRLAGVADRIAGYGALLRDH